MPVTFFDGQKLLREIENKYLYKLSIENGIVNVIWEQTSINVGNGTSIAINKVRMNTAEKKMYNNWKGKDTVVNKEVPEASTSRASTGDKKKRKRQE